MKRVLMVAYYFPPVSTSGAMRPLAFCRHLPEFGWLPRVLTADPRSIQPPLDCDENLSRKLPAGVHVDRVEHPNPLMMLAGAKQRLRERLRFAGAGAAPSAGADGGSPARAAGRLATLKEATLERMFAFPDRQRAWRRPAVKRIARFDASERPDVVFATGGPWTSLLAGLAASEHFDVPLVSDFRDPWTLNPIKAAPHSERRARRLERAVCQASSAVIANTPELRDAFVADYPEFSAKFVTITNGFDTDIDCGPPARERPAAADRLELCHFGTLYGQRDPHNLLLAVQQLADSVPALASRLCLRFVGRWEVTDPRCNAVAEALERRGLLTREPPIAHEAALREMRRVPALLVIQPASPLQVPGKIYEYIASGRPLLVVGGEGATAALVDREALGRCSPNLVEALVEVLRDLVSGGGRLMPPLPANVGKFHYRALTGRLGDVLNAVCRLPRSPRVREARE